MNKLQTNVNDIKSVAKILKKELASMDFELSHSSALNLASRSLGFKNYQVYNGLLDKTTINSTQFDLKNYASLEKEIKEQKIEKYPEIYDKFVKLGQIQNNYIYIDRDLSEGIYDYFLIFELKHSHTGRIFFTPKYNSFLLFVYPTVQKAINYYHIKLESEENLFRYFEIIKHLNYKSWMTKDLLTDLMALMERVKKDKKILIQISNKYSSQQLEQYYKAQKND